MSAILDQFAMALQSVQAPGGAWYGVNTSQPLVAPFITMQRIASASNVTLLGPSDLQSTRMQIDVFSETIKEADAYMKAVDAALSAVFGAAAVPGVSQDLYEAPVKLWRITKDFTVQSIGG